MGNKINQMGKVITLGGEVVYVWGGGVLYGENKKQHFLSEVGWILKEGQ